MIERILGIIVPVFSIIALGYFYGRRAKPDMGWVNRISMNVLAPALIFSALSAKSFDVIDNRLLILGSIGVVLGSGLLAWPFAKVMRQDHRTFVPPMMFNNCGNMGLPLAVLAFGPSGFSAMVAVFTISNLLHFTVGAWMIDHHARFGRLLKNPMVWSTVVGFAFALTHPPSRRWPRLPPDRHCDGDAAESSARTRRGATGTADPVRLPAARGAEFHGRGAVSAGTRKGRLDRADRQHDVRRLRPARAGTGAALRTGAIITP